MAGADRWMPSQVWFPHRKIIHPDAASAIGVPMHLTGAKVKAYGLEDRSCGVSKESENITPSPEQIVTQVKEYLKEQSS